MGDETDTMRWACTSLNGCRCWGGLGNRTEWARGRYAAVADRGDGGRYVEVGGVGCVGDGSVGRSSSPEDVREGASARGCVGSVLGDGGGEGATSGWSRTAMAWGPGGRCGMVHAHRRRWGLLCGKYGRDWVRVRALRWGNLERWKERWRERLCLM